MMVTLLLASGLKMFSVVPVSASLPVHNVNTGLDYAMIQGAIDAPQTLDGHTIRVDPGIYNELVSVNKALKIVGVNKETTIIDGNKTGNVVNLMSASVTITGFTIRNGGENYVGIQMDTYGGHNISGNIVSNCVFGIDLFESSDNTVVGNVLLDNSMVGINLAYSSNNKISGNSLYGGTYGIKIDASSIGNEVTNNTVAETSYGIVMTYSGTNIVDSNNVSTKVIGVYSVYSDGNTVSNNIVWRSAFAIELYGCKSSNILGNTMSDTGYGIYLAFASNNTIDGNLASNNDWGIYLYDADINTIKNTTASYNTNGIYIVSGSNGNSIYFNNFIHNVKQLYQDPQSGANTWYTSIKGKKYGNYWTDYNGLDTDNDGVGDTLVPHAGVDYYPLINPTMSVNDIALTRIETSNTTVYEGAIVNITVTARNEGTVTKTFNVTTKYYDRTIDTKTVTNLDPYASTTLVFNWNTAGVPTGFNYTISAEASTTVGETDKIDNVFIDGKVEVKAALAGDINYDGTVNMTDLTLFVQAYGSTLGSLNWNPNADLNKDNIISALDLYLLGKNYGKTA